MKTITDIIAAGLVVGILAAFYFCYFQPEVVAQAACTIQYHDSAIKYHLCMEQTIPNWKQ